MLVRGQWLIALTILTLAYLTSGCDDSPQFDPAAKYTPESLGQELAFRAKILKPGQTSSRKKQSTAKRATVKEKSKAAEATKSEPAATIDDLIEETMEKVVLIEGTPRTDVITKMIATIEADQSLTAEVKKELRQKLEDQKSTR